jgi:hypothetical protein
VSLQRRRYRPYPKPYPEFIRLFNRSEFRACVDPLEVLYFRRGRSAFYRGLIQLVVALLQLRLGMIRSPRVLLTSSRGLLAPFVPAYRGLHVDGVTQLIDAILARLPQGVVALDPAAVAALDLPRRRLCLRGPRARSRRRLRPRDDRGTSLPAEKTD